MTPQRQLTIANVLMSLGIAPLLLAEIFVASTLAGNWQADPRHEALALSMVISMLYTGALAVLLALPVTLWSWLVARRHADLKTGRVLRRVVLAALLLPPILMFVLPHR